MWISFQFFAFGWATSVRCGCRYLNGIRWCKVKSTRRAHTVGRYGQSVATHSSGLLFINGTYHISVASSCFFSSISFCSPLPHLSLIKWYYVTWLDLRRSSSRSDSHSTRNALCELSILRNSDDAVGRKTCDTYYEVRARLCFVNSLLFSHCFIFEVQNHGQLLLSIHSNFINRCGPCRSSLGLNSEHWAHVVTMNGDTIQPHNTKVQTVPHWNCIIRHFFEWISVRVCLARRAQTALYFKCAPPKLVWIQI